jgi:hypothetical protein
MSDKSSERLESAWRSCRQWITDFDGSVTQAEFSGVKMDALPRGWEVLQADAINLRILPIWRDEVKNPPVDLPGEALIERLEEGDAVALTVNYDILPEENPVEIHLLISSEEPGQAVISASWWADQVFPEEVDTYQRFSQLFDHLITLQQIFSAAQVHISPEQTVRPDEPGSLWLEI